MTISSIFAVDIGIFVRSVSVGGRSVFELLPGRGASGERHLSFREVVGSKLGGGVHFFGAAGLLVSAAISRTRLNTLRFDIHLAERGTCRRGQLFRRCEAVWFQ